jgi:hypothetical protein
LTYNIKKTHLEERDDDAELCGPENIGICNSGMDDDVPNDGFLLLVYYKPVQSDGDKVQLSL